METMQIVSWLYDKAARAMDHSYARMLNMAARRLRELYEKKWIPVTERLPDKTSQCICRYVFGENEEYPFYQVLWYFTVDKNPHFQNEGSLGLRVTHWMPLPEPPKEVNGE